MKRLNNWLKFLSIAVISLSISWLSLMSHASAAAKSCPSGSTADSCQCDPDSGDFLGLTPWYEYLKQDFSYVKGTCGFHTSFNATCTSAGQSLNGYTCTAQDVASNKVIGVNGGSSGLGIVWLIGLAIFEDLLRVAGIVAVGFVVYGGIRYVLSQGEPENTRAAQSTVINALIGLAIAIVAAASVSFIGNSLGGK